MLDASPGNSTAASVEPVVRDQHVPVDGDVDHPEEAGAEVAVEEEGVEAADEGAEAPAALEVAQRDDPQVDGTEEEVGDGEADDEEGGGVAAEPGVGGEAGHRHQVPGEALHRHGAPGAPPPATYLQHWENSGTASV